MTPDHDCKHDDRIIKMSEDIAAIRQSLENQCRDFQRHIDESDKYRFAIIGAWIALIVNIAVDWFKGLKQ